MVLPAVCRESVGLVDSPAVGGAAGLDDGGNGGTGRTRFARALWQARGRADIIKSGFAHCLAVAGRQGAEIPDRADSKF